MSGGAVLWILLGLVLAVLVGLVWFLVARSKRRRSETGDSTGGNGQLPAAGAQEKPTFGFFGAVTSAISIIPDVGGGKAKRDEDTEK